MISNIKIDMLNSMSLSELDVLKFIDSNKKVVLTLSIQKLSKKLFVSTATIMRLCKKLGFSGFSELKYFLKEEIQIEENLNKEITFESILESGIQSITKTAKNLDKNQLLSVVDLMYKAKRVHFFGKGLTNTIVQYASKLLLTNGCANFIHEDTHIAYISAEKMNQDDLVFLCSLSGNTHQIVRMAQIAKSRGAQIISITNNQANELSKIGDINIGFFMENKAHNPVDVSSRLPILYILDIIAHLYINKDIWSDL